MKLNFGRIGEGIKVVVDSANGTGGVVAPSLYRSLGCEVVELYSYPDGRFPNHHPNPSDEKTLDDIKKAVIENVKTGEVKDLEINGIFPYIGFTPNVKLFNGQIEQDSNGFIKTDVFMQTSTKGVFAIGDCRNTPLRQVITAAADGAIAAVQAGKYQENLK